MQGEKHLNGREQYLSFIMSDFYLVLPSNVDQPGNATNQFRVRLPDPIELNGKWEVALVEMMYPHSWPNVRGVEMLTPAKTLREFIDQMNLEKKIIKDADNVFAFHQFKHSPMDIIYEQLAVVLPCGYFATPEELIKALEEGIKNREKVLKETLKYQAKNWFEEENADRKIKKHGELQYLIKFHYNNFSKRMEIQLNTGIVTGVKFSEKLEYMLGLERNTVIYDQHTTGKYQMDLSGGFYSLYVYSDLVEAQVIGNVKAQLLRVVPIEGNFGEFVSKTFYSPHYVPVLKKTIDSVEINIKDDTNRLVPFEFGKCVLKLHFRKKRPIPL